MTHPAPTAGPVRAASRITLRPIGSSLPLGFLSLAIASILLSATQLGWIPQVQAHQEGVVLLTLIAPLQLLAAVFGFLARDSVGGTGMGILGGSWLATGATTLLAPPGARSPALGIALCAVAAALAIPTTAAALGKIAAAVVMGSAATRFALSGAYELAGSHTLERVSGWWGVVVAAFAFYSALAFELEDVRRRTLLPTGRHGAGQAALHGGLGDELDRVEHEAGVREQL